MELTQKEKQRLTTALNRDIAHLKSAIADERKTSDEMTELTIFYMQDALKADREILKKLVD